MNEHFSMVMTEKIIHLAKGHFDESLIVDFIATYNRLVGNSKIVDSILQISTDEGEELEIGFFTSDTIADITLSHGKVYSCIYPLSKVQNLNLSETENKWILTITGEKKFDYNVVKPGTVDLLKKYEESLREHILSSPEL